MVLLTVLCKVILLLLTAFCLTECFNSANLFLLLTINAGANYFLITANGANCYLQASSHHYTYAHKVFMYRMYTDYFLVKM